MELNYCVISHTHWDREWYLPFENFRIKLVDLIDNLLDVLEEDETFRFHLDAQTIILEDYLEIKPYNREKLKKYIGEERILVGPWYVQNDFFLTSGEATIRNLLIGSKIAQEFGKCSMVGYAPDQFGIISQLPQIFNKFDIDTCLFARGYALKKPTKSEIYWKCEDGSRVLGVYMPHWYNNAQRFSEDVTKSIKILNSIGEKLESTSTTSNYLLMNGVDHLEAQGNLNSILKELNKNLPKDRRIFQCTMAEYMDLIKNSEKNIPEYTGEMRNGGEYHILAGTLSSRVYLKQYNTKCQIMLENRLEPIYTFIEEVGGKEYPVDLIRYLWKLLMENHAHDSICGCSVDKVHEHMMDRFKRFEEVSAELLERGMEFISSYINREGLSADQYIINVFNTHQCDRNEIIEIDLEFPKKENVEAFLIKDELGKDLPYIIIDKRVKAKGILSPINLPGVMEVDYYRVKLWIEDVPGLGYKTIFVTKDNSDRCYLEPAEGEQETNKTFGVMENQYLRVSINSNGTIDLFDKACDKTYENILFLEDREDIGDAYVYKSNSEIRAIYSTSSKADVKMLEDNCLGTSYSIFYKLELPEKYNFEKHSRSVVMVEVPVELILTLNKNSKLLQLDITIDNRVKDHRLRVFLPTGINTNISMAGSPFDSIKRDKFLFTKGLVEVADQPNSNYINVDGAGYGIALLNEGLYEYENLLDNENTIALTLLRGNGYISMDGGGLPLEEKWIVPGNQCIGTYSFKLALYPHTGDFYDADVVLKAQEFLNPLFACFQPIDEKKFSGGRPFVQDSDTTELFFSKKKYDQIKLPYEERIMKIVGKNIVLSALKRSEKQNSSIIRLYNTSSKQRCLFLELLNDSKKAYIVNLKEERIIALKLMGKCTEDIIIMPKEIITIEII